jgi:predicted RNA-binding Zn ribbon-like protein
VRRAALFKEKCDELVLLALTMADKQISEAEKRNADPADAVDAFRVGVVALGNLASGVGYVSENRRNDLVARKGGHAPACDALARFPEDAATQQACLVCLSNFALGDGHGADLVHQITKQKNGPQFCGLA